MATFDRLKKLKVDKNTAIKYEMVEVVLKDDAPPVVLMVRPATELNEAYFNALLKSRNTRAMASQPTVKALKVARQEDVRLFPQHVVVGWENVFGDDGQQVPFSPQECEKFLGEIADVAPDVFTRLRVFVQDPSNWRPDAMDVQEAAKN